MLDGVPGAGALLVQSKLSAEIVERRWQFDWSRTEFELERSADVDDVGIGETADFAEKPAGRRAVTSRPATRLMTGTVSLWSTSRTRFHRSLFDVRVRGPSSMWPGILWAVVWPCRAAQRMKGRTPAAEVEPSASQLSMSAWVQVAIVVPRDPSHAAIWMMRATSLRTAALAVDTEVLLPRSRLKLVRVTWRAGGCGSVGLSRSSTRCPASA